MKKQVATYSLLVVDSERQRITHPLNEHPRSRVFFPLFSSDSLHVNQALCPP
jgi:hypothetical protein